VIAIAQFCLVLNDTATGVRGIPNSVVLGKIPESPLIEYRLDCSWVPQRRSVRLKTARNIQDCDAGRLLTHGLFFVFASSGSCSGECCAVLAAQSDDPWP